jgi:ubiquinone/menaquinone biosynthesis C-methylase UbiE
MSVRTMLRREVFVRDGVTASCIRHSGIESMSASPGNFERVNQLSTAASVFQFLEVTESLTFTQSCKQQMRLLAPVRPGQRVLDVGCGLGHEIRRLGALVGANGCAVGVDAHGAAVAEANRTMRDAMSAPAFARGSAEQLPFEDGCFDVVRAERVAEYVDSPSAMFAQMYRVLRPGGTMIAFDFDYGGSIVDASDRRMAERVNRLVAAAVPNPWIGGQLWGHFAGLGLKQLSATPMTYVVPFEIYRAMTGGALDHAAAVGDLDRRDLATWWSRLEQAHRDGRFFASLTGMIVCGVK